MKALDAVKILHNCLLEAGDDTEAGFAAAEYILSVDEPGMAQNMPAPTEWTKDTYPRDNSGRFVDKHLIVDAAHDSSAYSALCESIPQEEHWKLEKAITTLQGGGTIHHPSEPPGMAVDLSGAVANREWAHYTYTVNEYEEWGERYETRKHCVSCLRLATRNLRSKDTQNFERINELLEQAGIGDRERRSLRRAQHRRSRDRISQGQLEDVYEYVIERAHRRVEKAASTDPEMEEPKAPGDHTYQACPAALAISAAPASPSGEHPRVMRRYGAKPGPGWVSAGISKFGTPVWMWGPSRKSKAPEPDPPASLHRPESAPMPPTPPSESVVDELPATGPPELESASPDPSSGMMVPPIESNPAVPIAGGNTVRPPPEPDPEDSPQSAKARDMAIEPSIYQGRLDGGANGSHRIRIGTVDCVWKTSDEEEFLRYNIKQGTYYRREAAAYSVANVVELTHLVPITVERREGDKIGSVQQWVHGAENASDLDESDRYDGEEDHKLTAAFDYLIGNTDRHANNWMLDADGKLKLIDHGLAFPGDNSNLMSYPFSEASRTSRDIPEVINSWDEQKIVAELQAHNIEEEAINKTVERLRELKAVASSGGKFSNLKIQNERVLANMNEIAEKRKRAELAKIETVP